jgi:hypothetical protein
MEGCLRSQTLRVGEAATLMLLHFHNGSWKSPETFASKPGLKVVSKAELGASYKEPHLGNFLLITYLRCSGGAGIDSY